MEILIHDDPASVARAAADEVERHVASGPTTLGVSTGSTPRVVWTELVRRHEAEQLSFAEARAVTLYEYVGVGSSDARSFLSVISQQFLDAVGIAPSRVLSPQGDADDPAEAATDFEVSVAALGGIDVQVLGIGPNGHLAFNEPMSSLGSRTRAKTLTDEARAGYAGIFGTLDEVPFEVLTQGIATIQEARHIVLVGLGESRADAVAAAVEGPVSALCPASALQLHPHVTVLVDEGAASRLVHAPYYRGVAANRVHARRRNQVDSARPTPGRESERGA